ncbi:MAG TPA: radical SAM protein [Candidatus Hypogeohydataceae bacterium YC41]
MNAINNNIKGFATLERILKLRGITWNFIKYNALQPFFTKPFLPKTLLIYVTYRCNARCIMCGIWKGNSFNDSHRELSPEELSMILSDKLFSKVEHVNISGGEPTLREDLVELIAVILKQFPRLKSISMVSNGLLTHRMTKVVEDILILCKRFNIPFSLSISVHGVDDTLDRVYGIKGSFERINETIGCLKALQQDHRYALNLNCVITKINLENIPELIQWGKMVDLPITFILGELRERFMNLDTASNIVIPKDKKDLLIKFLRTLSAKKSLFNHHAFRYKALADMIEFNTERDISCHYDIGGVILGSEGDIHYCPQSSSIGSCRERSAFDIYYDAKNIDYRINSVQRERCPFCPPLTFNKLELHKDMLKYLKFLVTNR